MNNLIPEKRMDRNGKLVTKHVRAVGDTPARKLSVPAPTAAKNSPSLKLTAGQKAQKELSFFGYQVGMEGVRYPDQDVFCNASEAEFYEVVSVIPSHNEVVQAMIRGGCRDTEHAEEYLRQTSGEAPVDRSLLAQEALRRRIKPQAFVSGYAWFASQITDMKNIDFDESSPEGVSRILDTVEFLSSPLHKSSNGFMWRTVLKGELSYEDIKYLGINELKSYNRLFAMSTLLNRIRTGEADCTLEDVRNLLQREVAEARAVAQARENRDSSRVFNTAVDALLHRGAGFINRTKSLELIERQHFHYTLVGKREYSVPDMWERIEYAVLFAQDSARNTPVEDINPFFEAGIPVELAVDVYRSGGGVLEARAIHEAGINKSVSGGWL